MENLDDAEQILANDLVKENTVLEDENVVLEDNDLNDLDEESYK
jgi:hypothetical protein